MAPFSFFGANIGRRHEEGGAVQVMVNGQPREVAEGTTVAQLVQACGLDPQRIAVELDRVIVPRAELGSTRVSEGAKVEIVHFVGGG